MTVPLATAILVVFTAFLAGIASGTGICCLMALDIDRLRRFRQETLDKMDT